MALQIKGAATRAAPLPNELGTTEYGIETVHARRCRRNTNRWTFPLGVLGNSGRK